MGHVGGLIVGVRLSQFSENVTFYSAMVSDGSVAGVARDRRVGGLSASMYLLTVSLWMPSSLAIRRMDRPSSLARFTAFQRSCGRRFRKPGARGCRFDLLSGKWESTGA